MEGKRGGKLSREIVGGKIITLFPREWRRKISGEIMGGNYSGKMTPLRGKMWGENWLA